MKRFFCTIVILLCFFMFLPKAKAHPLDFTVLQLGEHSENVSIESVPHIFIVGGIQGDEPGGFSAAALLGTHYRFKNGYVTIIPNLNFLSIINRNRGSFGDMNRKFATISKNDPDYATVKKVQELITSPEIDLILNLHDGGGFYSPKYISTWVNPNRWGNSVIIDQEVCDAKAFGNLGEIGREVVASVQQNLLDSSHTYHLRNTETAKGDKEMEKTLTWFAIGKGKPAFGVEASKNLNVPGRVYYHLHAVEAFFRHAGISFERDFPLTTKGIQEALSTNIYLGFMENSLVLPLENIRRPQLGIFPMEKDFSVKGNSPILTAVATNSTMQVHYGNNRLTNFRVEFIERDTSLKSVDVELDGTRHTIQFGDIVYAKEYVKMLPVTGYRLNAIGAVVGKGAKGDESNIKIYKKDFQTRFSVDKSGNLFRFEVYKENAYVGTFMVSFAKLDEAKSPIFTPLQ